MRALRRLLITIAVLVVLFVAADRISVNVAESKVAEKVRTSQGFTSDPDVSIKGFPFLTQLLGSDLNKVRVNIENVETTGGTKQVRISRMALEFNGVRLSNSFSTAVADRASGTVLVSYADLSDEAPVGTKVSYGGNGRLKVSASLIPVSVLSDITVNDGNEIQLRAEKIPVNGLGSALEQKIRDKIDYSVTVTSLPDGIKVTKAEPGPDGVSFALVGSDVRLAG